MAGAGAHGRRCTCIECAMLRSEPASVDAMRASYEAALDVIAKLVAATPELRREEPACRSARAFLVEAGRRIQ